ncbi:MAG: TolC family protein [Gammaproteobacteria bacterium]
MTAIPSRVRLVALSSVLLAAGCASVPDDAGFSSVSQAVSERLDKTINWNQGDGPDEATLTRIHELLAKPLTPDSAVQLALLNSPAMQSTYEDLGFAAASLSQAGRPKNPLLGGLWLHPRDGAPTARDFDVRFDLLDLLLIPMRIEIAEGEFESTKQMVTGQVMDYAALVRKAFYEMQAAVHREGMFNEVAESAAASFDTASRLRRIGNISELTFNRYQLANEEAKLSLADAKLAVVERREALNQLMGIQDDQGQWSVGSGLPPIPVDPINLDELMRRATDVSMDLEASRQRIRALEEQLSVTGVQSVLEDLEVGYAWDEESSGEWKDGPSIEFKLPIFDQGQGERGMARAMLNKARADYQAQQIALASSARSLTEKLRTTRAKLDRMIEALLPLSRNIFEGMLLEYNAMQVDVFRLLRAFDTQVAIRQRFIDTLRDYWLLRADLETLLSGRSIEMAASSGPAMSGGGNDGGH